MSPSTNSGCWQSIYYDAGVQLALTQSMRHLLIHPFYRSARRRSLLSYPATSTAAIQAPGGAQQEHSAGHAGLLFAGFTGCAPLRAANVRFWVTMWPRSSPVSAASAIR